MTSEPTKLAVLFERISQLKEDLVEFIKRADSTFVTCKEFTPVKTIVYTAIGLILTAFLGVIIKTFIK